MKRIARTEKSKRLQAENRILNLENDLKAMTIQCYNHGTMPRVSNFQPVFASMMPSRDVAATGAAEQASIENVEVPAYLVQ